MPESGGSAAHKLRPYGAAKLRGLDHLEVRNCRRTLALIPRRYGASLLPPPVMRTLAP